MKTVNSTETISKEEFKLLFSWLNNYLNKKYFKFNVIL